MDYTQISDQIWIFSKKQDELFEFDENLFHAHGKSSVDSHAYARGFIFKVLPNDAKLVNI